MLSFRRTRLAPSPTGALHLGHARTFLITWWMARQAGAQIVMRMEDLDANRRKAESIGQAYDDLRWLGMEWDHDETQTANSKRQNGGEVVQSDRMALYDAVLAELFRRGQIYPCRCTRKDIAAAVAASVAAPHEGEETPPYPGTCRKNLGLTLDQLAPTNTQNPIPTPHSLPAVYRLLVPTGAVTFTDLIAGPQSFDVARDVGDFPLTRFDGPPPAPAYQLAVVTDDHAMGIDMVIRGDDLLSSTPRQIALYSALGWTPPSFAHVPLVIGPDGKRLAKRHGESRIAQFRAAGVSPEKVIGWVAWRSGQSETPREISAAEMIARFDLAKLPRQRVVLNNDDLRWLRP